MNQPFPLNDEDRRLTTPRQVDFDSRRTSKGDALDEMASLAAQICGTPIAAISFLDEQHERFDARVGLDAVHVPRSGSFGEHTILLRNLFIVPDTARDKRFADNPLVTGVPRVRFYAGLPLISEDGQMLGVLGVMDRAPRRLSAAQQNALGMLSRQVMAQIELRRLRKGVAEDKTQRLNRLYAVSSAVNSAIVRTHDLERLNQEVCRIAVESGGMHMAWVGLAELGSDQIRPAAWWGANNGYVQTIRISTDAGLLPGRGPAGEAFRTGKGVCSNNIDADPNFASKAEAAERGYKSCAAFPLKLEERAIGILVVYSGQTDAFTAEEMSLLGALAENLSFAIDVRQKELRKQQAEAALGISQAHLRAIIDSVDGIVWEADAQTFRFTFVSPRAERLLGYPIKRWIEEPEFWAGHVHPDDRQGAVAYCMECARENRSHEFEYRMMAADGRAVWLRDLVTVVPANGGPAKLRGIMVDISEAKRAEAAAHEAARFAHSTIDALSAHICVLDAEGNILATNEAWRRFAEANHDSERGAPRGGNYLHVCSGVKGPESSDALAFAAGLRAVIDGKQAEFTLEYPCHTPTEQLWFLGRVSRFPGKGPVRVVVAHENITARKNAAEALRRSEELFRAIVEDQTEMIVRWKPDGTRTFVNEAYCRVFGAKREELVGTSFYPLVAAEYREMIRQKILALTPARPVVTTTHESLGLKGERLWQEWTDRGLFDQEGRLVELQSTGRDITERKQAEQRIEHLTRVYAVLSDINETIVREPDTEALLQAACRIAVEKGRFRMAWIGMIDESPLRLRVKAHAGAPEVALRTLDRLVQGNECECPYIAHALRAGEHGVCNNIERDLSPDYCREAALQLDYRAMTSLPLKAGGKVVGTFNLYAGELGFFDADELSLLDELAVDIGFALEIGRRETERRAAETRNAQQRNALISLTGHRDYRSSDITAALSQLTEAAARTLGVSRVSIWRYKADHSAIECVDMFELKAGRHSFGAVLSAAAYPAYFRALAEVNVIAANDSFRDPHTREFTESYLRPLDIQSMLDVPIQVGGVLDGVLCHEHIGSKREWTADEKTFAVAMGNLVALALEGWERGRAERAVAEKNEVLETIFNNAPVMLCFTDASGRVQMANREIERVTGWTLKEIHAHPNIFEEWYPDPEYRAQVMDFIRAGNGQFSEFQTRTRSGNVINTTFANVPLSGGTSLGIGIDITARKGSERQLAAFATLGRRLGGASTAKDAARIVMDAAYDLFGWDACWLHMYDPRQDQSTSVLNIDIVDGRRQDVPPAYETGAPPLGVRSAIDGGAQLILREKSASAPTLGLLPFGDTLRRSASLMIVPVRHGGELIAVLSIQSYTFNAYRREDLSALEALADYCGAALAQIRASEARRESEQRFRELAETIEDIFWITDPSQTRLYYISPAYERVWGRSCKSLYDEPRSWTEDIHPDDRARVAKAAAARQSGETYEEEYRLVRPDGAVRWIRDRAFPVRDDSGRIVRIVGVARDVTTGRIAEQELHKREEEFRSLIENASDLITVVNGEGLIRFQSPSAERILGYPPEEMVGRNALSLVHPDDVAQITAALSRSLTDPATPIPVEYRIRHQNGTWHTLQSIGRNIPHRAADGFIVINSRDITDNRRLEEQFRQSQKMEAIGQLAGGVAHDFNNILTVIQGYGSLLMTTEDAPAESTEAAQQIVQAAERAANLTRQLLAFSRRQVMQSRRLDLNEVVISLAKMLQRIVGEDVRLQLNLHPRPVMTRADAGMLDQVLINLVVNARDAMPSGGKLVIETTEKNFTESEARAIQDAKPGRHVCIRVSDSGSGISEENLSRIFEPFFTTKEPGKGTGLGLATVFGIVKQHGGSLAVESEVARGTTFQIFLPAIEATADSAAEEKAKPKPRGGTETILIVEDEAAVRILTRIVLERQGYRILEAANGVEALQVWEQHQGDVQLLLTDIVMPEGMTGRELAERLQERNPRLRVIFTSGYSADIAGRELDLQEGQNFLQKPCPPDEITATIRRSLDGR